MCSLGGTFATQISRTVALPHSLIFNTWAAQKILVVREQILPFLMVECIRTFGIGLNNLTWWSMHEISNEPNVPDNASSNNTSFQIASTSSVTLNRSRTAPNLYRPLPRSLACPSLPGQEASDSPFQLKPRAPPAKLGPSSSHIDYICHQISLLGLLVRTSLGYL